MKKSINVLIHHPHDMVSITVSCGVFTVSSLLCVLALRLYIFYYWQINVELSILRGWPVWQVRL